MKQHGFTGRYVRVEKSGAKYLALDTEGLDTTSEINTVTRSAAFNSEKALGEFVTKTEKIQWRQVPMHHFNAAELNQKISSEVVGDTSDLDSNVSKEDVIRFIHNSPAGKPKDFIISDRRWKYLIRSAIRGKNIMITGPSGSGKTQAIYAVAAALPSRLFIPFNLGATQDPRSTLIGNTHFNTKTGTFFSESAFVKAIQTPNAIILLDELTRAHPEAWNILMSVLDYKQRYLRIDEHPESPTVQVASGVSFLATANIGVEYTATRVLDRALSDRFVVIEMEVLNEKEEFKLLKMKFPDANPDDLSNLSAIAHHTRVQCEDDSGKISNMVSTRSNEEAADLLVDGFTLEEVAEVVIYPIFDKEGGADSERAYVMKFVQQFIKDDSPARLFEDADV